MKLPITERLNKISAYYKQKAEGAISQYYEQQVTLQPKQKQALLTCAANAFRSAEIYKERANQLIFIVSALDGNLVLLREKRLRP